MILGKKEGSWGIPFRWVIRSCCLLTVLALFASVATRLNTPFGMVVLRMAIHGPDRTDIARTYPRGTRQSAQELVRGRVIRELATRILSRNVRESTVVAVGDTAADSSVTARAAMGSHKLLFIRGENQHQIDEKWWSQISVKPTWVLLLFVDTGGREGASIISARSFLENTTVTYM